MCNDVRLIIQQIRINTITVGITTQGPQHREIVFVPRGALSSGGDKFPLTLIKEKNRF